MTLNPYLAEQLKSFGAQSRFYRAEAIRLGAHGDPLETARQLLAGMLWGYHGIWVGSAALAGIFVVAWRVWRRRREDDRPVAEAMLLSYLIGFALLYGAVTQAVLGQNLLPVLPFTSLAAAVSLLTFWRLAGGRLRLLADRRVTAAVVAAFSVVVAQRANGHAYRVLLPSTTEAALEMVGADYPPHVIQWVRLDGSLRRSHPEPGKAQAPPPSLRVFDSKELSELPRRSLDRADAEIFPYAYLEGGDDGPYRRRLERVGRPGVRVVRARPFRAWGPKIALIGHPWLPLGSRDLTLAVRSDGTLEHRLSASTLGREIAALEFWLPRAPDPRERPRLEAAGRTVELLPFGWAGGVVWVSDRFPVAPDDGADTGLRLPRGLGLDRLGVTERRWVRPESGPPDQGDGP